MRRIFFIAFLSLSVAIVGLPMYAESTGTPIDFMLSELEFYSGEAWNVDTIQRFLNGLPGGIRNLRFQDSDDVERSAAEIIADAARVNDVNPKVLLATLQKEQSLLEDANPSQDQLDWAMGYGVCDDCRHDDPGIQKFRGFAVQVRGAAARFKYYREHPNEFTFRMNKPTIVDGITVTPQNPATAALLNYTPHLAGNIRFLELWRKYFAKQYTEGSLLQVPRDTTVWYIQYGRRRGITSSSVLMSRFDVRRIIRVSPFELERYVEGPPIRFPQYAILRSPKKELYLLQDDLRRRIPSMKAFRLFGFNTAEIVDADEQDLVQYEEGSPLTKRDLYPLGALLEDKKRNLFYVRDGMKYPILDRALVALRFSGRHILKLMDRDLQALTLGAPLALEDGTLARSSTKGSTTIYVIDHGLRRAIRSPDIFRDRGYAWNNVKVVTDRLLALHPIGEPVEF
ncbi:MAG: hypothetical protein HZB10_02585 [Candidatus Yonathbacteria bacterium]|nr:hypothetical protein [Candidatus Yonathbacteria bacterium]